MVGKSIARSTRSGTLVGPGICRKCLPALRGMHPPLRSAERVARRSVFYPAAMDAQALPVRIVGPRTGDAALAARLRREIDGEVLFDAASRGRYSTDASIYQVQPIGVVVPRSEEAGRAGIALPRAAG